MATSELTPQDISNTNKVVANLATFFRLELIYGPAERHGAVEWMFSIRNVDSVQLNASFAIWVDEEGHAFEGAAGLTTPFGALADVVRRTYVQNYTYQTAGPEIEETVGQTVQRADLLFEAYSVDPADSIRGPRRFFVARRD